MKKKYRIEEQSAIRILVFTFESLIFTFAFTMGEFSISDAIQQFLNQSRIKGDIQAMQIEDAWSKSWEKQLPAIQKSCRSSGIN